LVTINLALLPSLSAEPGGRKHIYIAGSSTVYPFSKAVARQVAASTGSPAPMVEATGTTAGLRAFCEGTGDRHPDIANASRRMQRSEFERCLKNGVKDIVEILIGIDAVAVVRGKSGAPLKLTAAHLFLALAKDVPDKTGQLSRNPFKKWSQIDPSLPGTDIVVLGPSQDHGTRDSLHELLLKEGAARVPALVEIRKTDPASFDKLWKALRTDGAYVEIGEGLLVEVFLSTVRSEKNALAIFGYSLFQAHKAKLVAVPIDAIAPTVEAITSGKYLGARKLYVYLNKDRVGVVPHLEKIATEFVSARALGPQGYLLKLGLLPPTEAEFMSTLAIVANMTPLTSEALAR
jgi:phosphate transport system substrate-binding protein